MENTIAQAIAAARQQDWSLVTRYLQQLPQDKQKNQLLLKKQTLREQLERLALAVLYEGDFQQRWEISKILPLLGKQVINPLIAIVEDEEVELELRWFVCRILGEFKEQTVTLALVNLIQQTEEEELAIAAAQSLAQLGTAAIEALSSLLAKPECRLLAVRSLAHIRRRETITLLLPVVSDRQPEIRATAIEALGSFHDERIPPILIEALTDPASAVRKQAVIALGLRGDLCDELDLVSHFQPLLYDLDLEICRQTAIALGRMGNDRAATVLFEVLQSPVTPTSFKLDLVRTLSWIETERALDYLAWTLTTENEPICQEIITVLGRVAEPDLKTKATQILLDFFQADSDRQNQPQLKQALALSLGELGKSQAASTLNLLAVDREKGVRLHAIAALKKLSSRRQ
ncbi:HEAT repeat domain-containing protein [Pleurocapsales cyanobacterium LEGE 06147]|nr:HEAT repeat domain-containing protein [Pleurocapsales cyanobacterium LEGE 06147]